MSLLEAGERYSSSSSTVVSSIISRLGSTLVSVVVVVFVSLDDRSFTEGGFLTSVVVSRVVVFSVDIICSFDTEEYLSFLCHRLSSAFLYTNIRLSKNSENQIFSAHASMLHE
jgi:Na+/melibiose symporter-like transporter